MLEQTDKKHYFTLFIINSKISFENKNIKQNPNFLPKLALVFKIKLIFPYFFKVVFPYRRELLAKFQKQR